jgi:hypothetical protein
MAGAKVNVICTVPGNAATQVVRVCEHSDVLSTGIPCTFQESLGNALVAPAISTTLQVTCPAARDAMEQGGKISIYQGPAFTDAMPADITCQVN